VPELLGLLRERADQPRMRMPKRIDGDTGREVELAVTVGRDQPGALAPLKSEIDARVSRQNMRRHEEVLSKQFPK